MGEGVPVVDHCFLAVWKQLGLEALGSELALSLCQYLLEYSELILVLRISNSTVCCTTSSSHRSSSHVYQLLL